MKTLERRFDYGISFFILAVSVFAAVKSLEFQPVSQWFPLFVSVSAAAISIVVIVFDVLADVRSKGRPDAVEAGDAEIPSEDTEDTPARDVLAGFAKYIMWFAGFAVLFILLGMPMAVLVWVFGFIRLAAHESWLRAAISAASITVALILLAAFLALALPHGLLIDSGVVIPRWRL